MAKRSKNGYALVTIIVIGSFAIVFLLTLANITTSAVRVSSENKWAESLRNAAEIGIDYAVNAYNSDQTYSLDQNTSANPFILPPSYLQAAVQGFTANSGIPNVSVQITVSKISDWATFSNCAFIYSPAFGPALPLSYLSAYGGGYRVIQSTATNQVYSKTIRVILKARLDTPPDSNTNMQTGQKVAPQSYFSLPLLSLGAFTFNSPSLTVQGFNTQTQTANPVHTLTTSTGVPYAAYDLSVTTNSTASVSAGTTIAGDLNVLSPNSGSPSVNLPASGPTVDGRVFMNGVSSSVNAPTGASVPGSPANVLANADTVNAPPGTPRAGNNASSPSVVNSPVATQTTVSPTPASSNVPAPATVQPSQNIPSLSALSQTQTSLTSANTTTGASGIYSSTGLATDGVASGQPVVIQNASAPVTFFVQDSSTPTPSAHTPVR